MSTGFVHARPRSAEPRRAESDAPVLNSRVLAAMALLCLAALALVTFGRLTGIGVQHVPRAPVVESRDLVFSDMEGGVIEIRDADGGALVQRIGTNQGGFLRTAMRGFAQERLRAGGDSETPFRLTLHANGHLVMADPVTGREVLLSPFGKPAQDAFGPLLRSGGAASGPSDIKAAGAAQTQGEAK
jgi:putative photosynthetic complex assembly protein